MYFCQARRRGALLLLLLMLSVGAVHRVAALQHSGMWGLSDGKTMDAWADITWEVSNVTEIAQNFKNYGVRALYPIQWTVTRAKKCFAPVKHTQTTPDGYFSCITMDPDYKSKWDSTWKTIKPLADSGAIMGIFLGDEHLYFGVTVAEVKLMADTIRRDWPSAVIYENEAPDVIACNYNKLNETIFAEGECVPQSVDWIGFDFYAHDASSWEVQMDAYRHMLYPRFSRPDQRVVPVSLGYADGNLTASDAEALDDFCAENARQLLQFGLSDNRVVGMFPFHWSGGTRNSDGSITGGAGIIDLPRCAATYRGIGQLILAAGPAGTSFDPVHNPPKPDASGTFPEPRCASPTWTPPSTWSWCDRS